MRRTLIFVVVCWGAHLALGQEADKSIPIRVTSHRRFIAFPVVVKSPEYKWGGGGAGIFYFKLKDDSSTRTSNIKAVSFFTLRKQLVFATEGTVYFPGERYIFHFTNSLSHFPDRFWGLGNDTPSGNLEYYSISQVDIFPQLLREVKRHLFVGIGYEYQNVFSVQYDSANGNDLFDQEQIVGRHGSDISGAGFILTWDSRNNAFSPSKGFYVQYFLTAYRGFMGSTYNFNIQNLDVRKYFPLKRNRVLAFQVNLVSTTGEVPLRNLANIGTNMYMRGYYEGRYQDKNMFAMQSEWRTPVFGRWGLVMFAGMGKVGDTVEHALDFKGMKPSYGAGLRFSLSSKEKLNLRVDGAFGTKSQGTYINMGEAF